MLWANGQISGFEMKTGNAQLTGNQASVFVKAGKDPDGNQLYNIPANATVTSRLLKTLNMEKGQTLAEAGYTNGIVIKEVRKKGLNDKG